MLRLAIYEGWTRTERPGARALEQAQIRAFTTVYGGLYGRLEAFVPGDPTATWAWQPGDRVVIWDGLTLVWEGDLLTIGLALESSARGLALTAVGMKSRLGRTTIHKRWADDRLDNRTWLTETAASAAERMRDDRSNRIRITPMEEEFNAGELYAIGYSMPTGRTIKRVTCNYAMSELATWSPREVRNGLTVLTNAADGDAATSVTLATFNTGQYLYVGSNREFNRVVFDLGGTVNANAATLSGEYVRAQTHAWTALSGLSDATTSSGRTLAQDGTVAFTMPADWAPDGLVGSRMFWVRFAVSANLSANIVINEVTVGELQAWELRLRDRTGGADIFSVTSSGSGSQDVTLATPRQTLYLEFVSRAKQTGHAGGSIYGQISSVIVYDETGDITALDVAQDVLGLCTFLSGDAGLVEDLKYDLRPFYTAGSEAADKILDRVVAFGDDAGAACAWALVDSEQAASPDGTPVLAVTRVPTLDDYEYALAVGEANLQDGLQLALDADAISNYVVVRYRDAATGLDVEITPADDVNLTDADSVAAYGPRHTVLDIGNATAVNALAYGQAWLARYGWPSYLVSGPLLVAGYLRTKSGGRVPAAQVQAGSRLRIENFIDDIRGVAGEGLTFVISATSHDPATNITEISTGNYDDLAVRLARMQ